MDQGQDQEPPLRHGHQGTQGMEMLRVGVEQVCAPEQGEVPGEMDAQEQEKAETCDGHHEFFANG